MTFEAVFADGQLAALTHYKLGWPTPTDDVVRRTGTSPLTPAAQQNLAPPASPRSLAETFNAHEQVETRGEPRRKLSAAICTSCRKTKHYGPCHQPRTIPTKVADFNLGLTGDDPSTGDNPSTSPHYHSATTADSALARARDGRPAAEQAASGFADLFRHQGIRNSADEPERMYGGLNKVSVSKEKVAFKGPQTLIEHLLQSSLGAGLLGATYDHLSEHGNGLGGGLGAGLGTLAGGLVGGFTPLGPVSGAAMGGVLGHGLGRDHGPKLGDWQLQGTDGHSMHEQRGPSVNPYEERLTIKSPPVGWGDEGEQRTRRAFDQIDGAVDTTSVGGGFGDPQSGPAVLG